MLQEPNYIREISQEYNFQTSQVEVVLDLTNEGATVPFIARYRKEKTGNLDEDEIRNILTLKTKLENLYEAKKTAINGIEEQDKMTPELMENILKAQTQKEVEEIYKPYKSKRKTKAMIAIENGFQPFADLIKQNKELTKHTPELAEALQIFSFEGILEWCQEIIAAEISANADLRASLIKNLNKTGNISSKYKTEKSLEKLNDKDKQQIPKFEIYSDFINPIRLLKPYQILALNRGENLGILNVKIEKEAEHSLAIQEQYAEILQVLSKNRPPLYPLLQGGAEAWEPPLGGEVPAEQGVGSVFIPQLQLAFKKGYDALFSSVENEIRSTLSELWEDDAIATFQINLKRLLMTKPEYGNKILAIDPWYAAGCKIAILDELGNPQAFTKIYLHRTQEAKNIITDLLEKHRPDVVIIGNGTGNKETIDLVQELTDTDIYIVNESGASVYSASKIAQEEFPKLDSLDRGTISIGRRFIDPLSELVKVPVGSIGVGLYQHDVPAKKLEEKLGNVVEDVVNLIGINVNNASSYVLNYISGIDKRLAKKIYNNRPYASREELKKQMSDKTYEQAIGFLRIPESSEKLDNTDIHPEQYAVAKYILENFTNKTTGHPEWNEGSTTQQMDSSPNILGSEWHIRDFFTSHQEELQKLYPDTNRDTIKFILSSYNEAGKEKRIISTHKKATPSKDISEIQEGDIVPGIVKNVVAFGAFVDIGLKNDGLAHVSHIADTFIKDPNDFLQVGQDVQVKVLSIDEKTWKIQLSIREAKGE